MKTYSRSFGLTLALLLAGCGGDTADTGKAAPEKTLRMGGTTSAATLDPIEVIAQDGLGSAYITNPWGGHQGRVTRHLDGTVRALYIRPTGDAFNAMEWRVMTRSPSNGAWTLEQSGVTTDDVNLLRDPVTDAAYVLAYPSSVPTVYVVPSGTGSAIPGTWQNVGPNSRHYSAVGIGADGTLCFKASVELAATVETSNTETHLICGNYSATDGWHWGARKVQNIGLRHAYDYVFPGGYGTSGQVAATAQSDLQKVAAGFPNADSSHTYVFNGIGRYTANTNGSGDLVLSDLLPPVPASSDATIPPLARMIDSFNDSKHRIISTYYVEPGNGTTTPAQGFYTIIANPDGTASSSITWSTLPTYGTIRIFEDASQRLWLLWMNQGSTQTQMWLYPVQQNASAPLLSLGARTDFGNPFSPYSIDGSPRLALMLKGVAADNVVDGMIAACEETYAAGTKFTSPYYPTATATKGTQNIIHFRIHLPQ